MGRFFSSPGPDSFNIGENVREDFKDLIDTGIITKTLLYVVKCTGKHSQIHVQS